MNNRRSACVLTTSRVEAEGGGSRTSFKAHTSGTAVQMIHYQMTVVSMALKQNSCMISENIN